jgi:hypothetical protein
MFAVLEAFQRVRVRLLSISLSVFLSSSLPLSLSLSLSLSLPLSLALGGEGVGREGVRDTERQREKGGGHVCYSGGIPEGTCAALYHSPSIFLFSSLSYLCLCVRARVCACV